MGKVNNRADVDHLKLILTDGWNRILEEVPNERVYAFGIYTNECGQHMFPFLLGEQGLERVAAKYVQRGDYTPESAVENLRWSTADSPYQAVLSKIIHGFDDRPDVLELPTTAMARKVNYRLTAGCTALRELDEQGLFGTGDQREGITLYIEGGDVNREWIFKWAKKLNPATVYAHFAKIGAPDDTVGTFTEFGTKKVSETVAYAHSADHRLIAAATQYQLFLFDTVGSKQLFAKALPAREDVTSLGGVAMSSDGKLIAVIPFGRGSHGNDFFIVTREKSVDVRTITLGAPSCAVAVSPEGEWIAVTDESGAVNVFSPAGLSLGSHRGHEGWPRGIAVTHDGTMLATADTKSLIVWDTSNWSRRHVLQLPVDFLDFEPAGRLLACSCRYALQDRGPRTVTLVDSQAGTVARELIVEGYRIEVARFSPDGRYLACAMRSDTEEFSRTDVSALIDVETGAVVDRLKADFEQVRDFAFLPHRKEIAVAVFGHTRRPLVLWQPRGWV